MPGGKGNIKPEDGKQFSSEYQPPLKWSEENALEVGNDLIAWLKEGGKKQMFFEDFLYLNNSYTDKLISYLVKKYTSFSTLIDTAKKIQKIKLIKYGVMDVLNPSMTKFVLINNHNMSDKTVIEQNTTDKMALLKELSPAERKKRIKELIKDL